MEDQRVLDIGGILSETANLVSACAREVALFTFLIGGVTGLGIALTLTGSSIMQFEMGMATDYSRGAMGAAFDIFVSLLSFVAGFFLMRRYLEANGRPVGTGDRLWSYVGLAILSVLGYIAGLILLIVPGIILMVRWSAASGFLISGEKGITESLGASFEATKGNSWQIFFAGLILLLGLGIIGAVLGGVFGVLSLTAVAYLSAFLEAFSNAISLAFGIAVYLLLTDGNEEVRDVFS